MKKLFAAAVFLFAISSACFAQSPSCASKAVQVEPQLTTETRKAYDLKLAEAFSEHERSGASADSIIWLGRRIAYLGNYKQAIRVFTTGIAKYPKDARFYRHRGHRYITLRCFDDAIKDLEKASELVKYKQDEVEPDGLPNARNIPTSTLKTNIYYHLGLAYYLKGNFARAAAEFTNCLNAANNADMKVAAAHWVYMSARRAGKDKAADDFVLAAIPEGLDIIENVDYYKLVKLYQDKLKSEDLLKEIGGADVNTISSASLGYGLGNWYLYNGKRDDATKIFRQITAGNQWASFGYIAADAELNRQKHER